MDKGIDPSNRVGKRKERFMIEISQYLMDWSAGVDANGAFEEFEVPYTVRGTGMVEEALDAVRNTAPVLRNSMVLSEVRLDEVLSHEAFRIKAVYAEIDNGEEESEMNFECSTGSMHITHAISQTKVYGENDAEIDENVGGMIGWNGKIGDGMEVSGVDVPTASMHETYTKSIDIDDLTTKYRREIAALVGKVNASSLMGWNAGEVMFLGCSFSKPQKKKRVQTLVDSLNRKKRITVSFHFEIHPNERNVVINGRNIGSKNGFEYLWSINKTETEAGRTRTVLRAVFKSVIVESANFSALGL